MAQTMSSETPEEETVLELKLVKFLNGTYPEQE
jgi:hypothetical protein